MNRLLRVEEVAERLGIKVSTVRAWIFSGRLRKVKLGRAVRVPEDFLNEFIQSNTRYERPSDG